MKPLIYSELVSEKESSNLVDEEKGEGEASEPG